MNVQKLVLGFFVALLVAGQSVVVADQPATDGLGERLVRQIWADLKTNDMARIEKRLAPGFQSVHEDGTRSRQAEIKLIEGLALGKYTLSRFNSTRNGPTIVVTYFAAAEETIEGKRVPTKPVPRMSVFMNTDDGWQLIAHANFEPLKSPSKLGSGAGR